MKASFLDLRQHMRQILKALELNETVTLTYRGKEKAKIVPTTASQSPEGFKEHDAFGMWADRTDLSNVNTTVRELRKGRLDAF